MLALPAFMTLPIMLLPQILATIIPLHLHMHSALTHKMLSLRFMCVCGSLCGLRAIGERVRLRSVRSL